MVNVSWQKVRAALVKAGHDVSKPRPSMIRGMRERTSGFVVSKGLGEDVAYIEHSNGSFRGTAGRDEKIRLYETTLKGAGFVTRIDLCGSAEIPRVVVVGREASSPQH